MAHDATSVLEVAWHFFDFLSFSSFIIKHPIQNIFFMVKFFIIIYFHGVWLFKFAFVNNVDMGTVAAFFIDTLASFKLDFFEIVI